MFRTLRRVSFVAVMAATAVLHAPAVIRAADNQELAAAASNYRVELGIGGVSTTAALALIAAERAQQLADARALGHDFDYLRQRFSELGVCWRGFGEIVAYSGSDSAAGFIDQWHGSATHRAILRTAAYDQTGGRSQQASNGYHYAVMVFVDACEAPVASSSRFSDIGGSQFRDDIEWLADAGITGGCSGDRFCPTGVVTREQMASFLARATRIAAAQRDWFRDDDASRHEADINRIASASIAAGCTEGRYCPVSRVTRGQMASFLVRALRLPAASRDWFADDNGSLHESDINRLAEAGITGGCAQGRFCPGASVTREQMAGFLRRAFES